jgi:hypothetical protein
VDELLGSPAPVLGKTIRQATGPTTPRKSMCQVTTTLLLV